MLGTVGYLIGLGVIGAAVGILLRSKAGAVGTAIGAVQFVATLAAALLPDRWNGVLKFLPSSASKLVMSVTPIDSFPSLGLRRTRCAIRWQLRGQFRSE